MIDKASEAAKWASLSVFFQSLQLLTDLGRRNMTANRNVPTSRKLFMAQIVSLVMLNPN